MGNYGVWKKNYLEQLVPTIGPVEGTLDESDFSQGEIWNHEPLWDVCRIYVGTIRVLVTSLGKWSILIRKMEC